VVLPDDSAESRRAMEALARKFPDTDDMAPPAHAATLVFVKFTPDVISILDYSKGFGHTDLVHIEAADLAR
jgi:hypothetical protein